MVGLERTRVARAELNKKYICLECKNIMVSPINCQKCEISCCMECSPIICKRHSQCDHHFSPINQTIKNEVANMYVKCKYNLQGCLKMTKYRDLNLHQKDCEFSKMACNQEECISQQKATKTKTHLKDCPYAVMVCQHCNKQMRRIEQTTHDCVKWLLSINENINVQNDVYAEEIQELRVKGGQLKLELEETQLTDTGIIEDLTKKNEFLQMYAQEMVLSLKEQNVLLNSSIADYTKDVLEKTDIQVRKNECFIDYVKNLNELFLDDSQKQNTTFLDYANKIQSQYVQKQVSDNISNSNLFSVQEMMTQKESFPQLNSQKINTSGSNSILKSPEKKLTIYKQTSSNKTPFSPTLIYKENNKQLKSQKSPSKFTSSFNNQSLIKTKSPQSKINKK